jgi:undecaprenyl-diphosphatase
MASVDVRALLALYGGTPHGLLFTPMLAFTIVGGGWASLLLVPMLLYARTRAFALPLALAVVTQALLVSAVKALVGRERPWIALGLPAPFGAPHDGSFPSGHAAGNFCVAAFLAVALPAIWPQAPTRARVLTAVAVVYAALVATSRVYLGAHFPSDVLAGALLGVLVGGAAGVFYVRRRAPAT